MSRFKLTIEYVGTRYSGWQIQKNARTVQGEIDRAVHTATRVRDFELYGSGRTDAGVHALAQVAHLDIKTTLPPETLRQRLNDELPSDINILSLSGAPRRFHARHDAVARSYLYQIARRRTAFAKPFVWWIKEPLDLALVRSAASSFTGLQDFEAFTDDEPEMKSTKVLVDAVEIGEDGDLLLMRVSGSHFLKDGAAPHGRDRRSGPPRPDARRGAPTTGWSFRSSCTPHGSGVWFVSRAGLL